MNTAQIQDAIEKYNEVLKLARAKSKKLEELDSIYYCTGRYIQEISMDIDTVYVRCDNSCRGSIDSIEFEFPISWLSKTDEELEDIVMAEKKNALKVEEERKLSEKMKKEQLEFEQYQKLKAKFEK